MFCGLFVFAFWALLWVQKYGLYDGKPLYLANSLLLAYAYLSETLPMKIMFVYKIWQKRSINQVYQITNSIFLLNVERAYEIIHVSLERKRGCLIQRNMLL